MTVPVRLVDFLNKAGLVQYLIAIAFHISLFNLASCCLYMVPAYSYMRICALFGTRGLISKALIYQLVARRVHVFIPV